MKRLSKHGFTLIELLAAMAILAIIVLMMARVFSGSARAWQLGTSRVEDSANARAALQMVADDLYMAGVADQLDFRLDSSFLPVYDAPGTGAAAPFVTDCLYFASMRHDTDTVGRRSSELVWYYLKENSDRPYHYQLVRVSRTSTAQVDYATKPDWAGAHLSSISGGEEKVLVHNIGDFAVYCYDRQGNDLIDVADYEASNGYGGKLPYMVEIYLMTVSEDTANKAAAMADNGAGDTARDFINRMGPRYQIRAYMNNRQGML